jgi:hypothetical protein
MWSIIDELNEIAQRGEYLIKQMSSEIEYLKINKAAIKEAERNNKGYSLEFDLDPSTIPDKTNRDRPSESWKSVFKEHLGGGKESRGFLSKREAKRGSRPRREAFTLDQLGGYAHAFDGMEGLDDVNLWKEQKRQGGGGAYNPKSRKWQKNFESQECQQARLAAIQSGEDVSDWQPY